MTKTARVIKCDGCGELFENSESPSHFSRAKSHFCSNTCKLVCLGKNNKARMTRRIDVPRHSLWEGARKRAALRDIPFFIEQNDIPNIPEFCPVLGLRLKRSGRRGPSDNSPSLDRLIPELGYVA